VQARRDRPTFLDSKARYLTEKLDRGEPVIGTIVNILSPELVEILAYLGLDYIIVDQMFSQVDWSGLAALVRAARGTHLVVIARIENDPWFGGADPGVGARAARAMGVGCDGVKVSVTGATDAGWALSAAQGWHRNLHVMTFAPSEFPDVEKAAQRDALVIPSVESKTGLAETPKILELPGLRLFGIALGDTSRMLGVPLQYEHPEVWKYVDHTAEIAAARGIDLCAGTGRQFIEPEEIASRVARMYEHKIRMIFIQTTGFLVHYATHSILSQIRARLGY
jgi:4-hydroxy-2-oxoheptanedioate aldolase